MATSIDQKNFVKTALRLPPELHAAVHEAAQKEGRSYNAELVGRIQRSFDAGDMELSDYVKMLQIDLARSRVELAVLGAMCGNFAKGVQFFVDRFDDGRPVTADDLGAIREQIPETLAFISRYTTDASGLVDQLERALLNLPAPTKIDSGAIQKLRKLAEQGKLKS